MEALDWGVYSHFRFQLGKHPELVPVMQMAHYLSEYLTVALLYSLAALLFLIQGKRRSAQVTAISTAAAFAPLFGTRLLVPRMRPPDAKDAEVWLGRQEIVGSYPSGGVFLFMLAMIFVGFALWGVANRWLRGIYILVATALTIWICLSQLMLGLHFLTDILGAMAAATMIGWIAYRVLDDPLAA